ncbi:MAG: hypothetical protein K9G11_03790 [Rickettsiaceae bacterium]|nr:hypothetical protein [Rickettsiaceae bacterium]
MSKKKDFFNKLESFSSLNLVVDEVRLIKKQLMVNRISSAIDRSNNSLAKTLRRNVARSITLLNRNK